MNYRTIISSLFFLVSATILTAQEKAEKKHFHWPPMTHELGINSTNILSKIVKITTDSTTENPYLLTYRLGFGRFGARLGVGGTRHNSKQTEASFADSKTIRDERLDARFGLDYQIELGRRCSGNFGLDFVSKRRFNKVVDDSGFDVIEKTNQSIGYGFGPAVGFSFWLNRHIGLFTEANFYLISSKTDSARLFKNFPELDDSLFHTESSDLQTILPASIFLIYRF